LHVGRNLEFGALAAGIIQEFGLAALAMPQVEIDARPALDDQRDVAFPRLGGVGIGVARVDRLVKGGDPFRAGELETHVIFLRSCLHCDGYQFCKNDVLAVLLVCSSLLAGMAIRCHPFSATSSYRPSSVLRGWAL